MADQYLDPIRIPTRNQAQPIVDDAGRSTAEFHRWLNSILSQFAYVLNAITALPEIQKALANLDKATDAAQKAADAAQAAADAAKTQNAAQARENALQTSYIDPSSVLTADPTTITIAAHTRHYGKTDSNEPEQTASVNGGTIPATATGDTDYVYYDDPDRMGGAVTYQVSTTQPVQSGDRHVVGAVMIPTTGTSDGGDGPSPPGRVYPQKFSAQPDQ